MTTSSIKDAALAAGLEGKPRSALQADEKGAISFSSDRARVSHAKILAKGVLEGGRPGARVSQARSVDILYVNNKGNRIKLEVRANGRIHIKGVLVPRDDESSMEVAKNFADIIRKAIG